ncbi:MAG: glycine C-acetyltransferase [Candidatus Calescibacterium sp.]|nr:glycine C-acetyltransferase [Candidatus Calescibacterium sp.]MDW8133032.1 glycine C-acetyltransferase [Candidatus Calescibacterium sp.]
MIKDKFDFLIQEIEDLKRNSRYNNIRVIEGPQGSWVTIEGRKKLNLCSNNYLGLANHPEIISFCIEGIKKYGIGPGAVRSIAGTNILHIELERKLSEFKHTEDTVLFQSGFNANLAVVPTFLDSPDDAVISDELNHASIIDSIRLSKAKRFIYRHVDMDDLESKLKEASFARRKMVITDGVFSMDGDIAPLPQIVELCSRYDAILVVDDAHGEGVLGRNGRGIVDHFDLHGKVDIEVGTLSKAFGVVGGFVSSNYKVIEFLKQKARPFLFSSALTIPDTLAVIKALDIILNTDVVEKLWINTNYFKTEMRKLGFDLGNSQTPITPVMLFDESLTQEFARMLFDEDVFAMPIFYPTVPKNKARIRVMISAVHSRDDLDFALEKFQKVRKKIGI